MLLVKTKLKASDRHGIGLFADQFIRRGTVTWRRSRVFDVAFPPKSLSRMPAFIKKQFLKYSYFDHGKKEYILCFDDQRFINHSRRPNIQSCPHLDKAIRDIKKGEELVCNYRDYEYDWFERRRLNEKSFKK